MSKPATHSAVNKLAVENASAGSTLRPCQAYTDNTITKKLGGRGSQMSAKYEYGEGMSVPQERQLFLPMLIMKRAKGLFE